MHLDLTRYVLLLFIGLNIEIEKNLFQKRTHFYYAKVLSI